MDDGWDDEDWSFDDDNVNDQENSDDNENDGKSDVCPTTHGKAADTFQPPDNVTVDKPVKEVAAGCTVKEKAIMPSDDAALASVLEGDINLEGKKSTSPCHSARPHRQASPNSTGAGGRKSEGNPQMEAYVLERLRQYSLEMATNSSRIRDDVNIELHQKFHGSDNSEPAAAVVELTKYYQSRSNLRQYTFEKEISRMCYRVKTRLAPPGGIVLMDNVEEIKSRFAKPSEISSNNADVGNVVVDDDDVEEILWRAANQSLLADALATLTNPDQGIVRPQFFATASATDCAFFVNLVDCFVSCECELRISIPAGKEFVQQDDLETHRVDLANMMLTVLYSPCLKSNPHTPMLQYFIQDIQPSQSLRSDPEQHFCMLRSAAVDMAKDWLEMGYTEPGMEHLNIFPEDMFQRAQQRQEKKQGLLSAASLRDALLFSDSTAAVSQHVMTASNLARATARGTQVGLASAWKELDSATNIGSKIDFIKQMKFVPSTEELMEEQQEQKEQKEQRKVHRDGSFTETDSAIRNTAVHQERAFPVPNMISGVSQPENMASVIETASGTASARMITRTSHPLSGDKHSPSPAHSFDGGSGANVVAGETATAPLPSDRAPMIGGLLFSGLSRMAKAVAVPDDDMLNESEQHATALYRTEEGHRSSPPPMLYRKEQVAPAPALYRLEEGDSAPPTLYRKDDMKHHNQERHVELKTVESYPPSPRLNRTMKKDGQNNSPCETSIGTPAAVTATVSLNKNDSHEGELGFGAGGGKEGWSDDEIDIEDDDEDVHGFVSSSFEEEQVDFEHVTKVDIVDVPAATAPVSLVQDEEAAVSTKVSDEEEDDDDDIVPTRKRWRRPTAPSSSDSRGRKLWFLSS